MPPAKTVSFYCPEDLHQQMLAYIDAQPEHENQSQFLRYLIRQELPEEPSEYGDPYESY